jgi:predicted RNA binding protein YcfA (HicA-like mRNA interferase family)
MSSKLPVLKPKQVLRALEKDGFFVHHQTGSHVQLKHHHRPGKRVTIPYHNKDLPKPIIKSIINQSGLTKEEFLRLIKNK